jgi:MFS family permease
MDLVGYRVVMGLGAAVLFTNSMAIVADEFIPFGQLGLAQGVFQLSFATGTVLGPVVGKISSSLIRCPQSTGCVTKLTKN